MTLDLLARLWLAEPGPEELERARRIPSLAAALAPRGELAGAWAELFLLGVYPYASVFTEPSGELNGASAREATRFFEGGGYEPPELSQTGAPDHVGLWLGFAAELGARDPAAAHEALRSLIEWLPACRVAIEREPGVHPFYVAVARETVRAVSCQLSAVSQSTADSSAAGSWKLEAGSSFARLPVLDGHADEEEISLNDVVSFLLAPARCGLFLSRARLGAMARNIGLSLPFGSRFDVARSLLASAGEADRLTELFGALSAESEEWRAAYRALAAKHPVWEPASAGWIARLGAMESRLVEMRALAADGRGETAEKAVAPLATETEN